MHGSAGDDALHLLLATKMLWERENPGGQLRPGTPVDPYRACDLMEWGAASRRCNAALEYLEAELALEPNAITVRAVGGTQYVWGTEAGLMLGEG